MSEKHYKAFISYSHQDEKFGQWLHKQLENYKIPKELQEDYPELPKKLFPLFRDREELSTSSDLGTEILKALHHSEYLIVICSPNSAKSQWVNQEIIDFKKIHGEKKVHAIIIDGEPHAKDNDKFDDDLECFPEALKYKVNEGGNLTNISTEPIAGDLRKGKDGKELGKLKLIAGLLGVKFDELNKREEKRNKRKRLVWSLVSSFLLVVMAGLTIFSWVQMERAEVSEEKALEQLIIAKQKTQSLSILSTKTISSLMDTDNKTVQKYLKNILNSGEKDIFMEMVIPLIRNSTSINDKDKIFFLDSLPKMNEKELLKLIKEILQSDMKTYHIKKKYGNIIKKANREASIRYIKESIKKKEIFKEECFNKKRSETCLKAISIGINTNYSNELILKFFKSYKSIISNPSAHYYILYGKYLVKEKKFKESLSFFEKAISIEPNNIKYIKSLISTYIKDGKNQEAFKLQNKIVLYKVEQLNILEDNQTKYSYSYVQDEMKFPPEFELRSKLMSELENLFRLQHYIEAKKITNELYPKYKEFIESMREWNAEGYVKTKAMVALAYINIKKYNEGIMLMNEIIEIYEGNIVLRDNMKSSWILDKYYNSSWSSLITGNYPNTIKYATKGMYKSSKDRLAFESLLAHGYLLSDDFKKAKNIYIQNIGRNVKPYNKLWENIVLNEFKILRKEGVKSDEFEKIQKIFQREKFKEIFQTWKNPKNPEYKNKKSEIYSNIIWITPSHKVCKDNNGKIEKGICRATYSDANNICHASGGNLPSLKEFRKIAFDCGGLELVSIEKNNYNNSYARGVRFSDQENLNKRIKKYQTCYEKKGFLYNNYWTSSNNSSFAFKGASGVYHLGGGSEHIRCIGTR